MQTSDAAQSGSIGVRCTGAVGVGVPALQHRAKLGRHVKNLGTDRSFFRVFSSIFTHFQPQEAWKVDLTLQKRKPVTDCTRVLEGHKRFIFGRYAAHLSHLYSFHTHFCFANQAWIDSFSLTLFSCPFSIELTSSKNPPVSGRLDSRTMPGMLLPLLNIISSSSSERPMVSG
jgi:hypothetical protein